MRLTVQADRLLNLRERERETETERERESAASQPWRKKERVGSHFGSSAAPLLGGLFRLLASGERRGVALRLCPQGSSRCLSQRCLS